MDDKLEHFAFGEGMSTRAEVAALLERWPPQTIKQGVWQVTDAEVKSVLGLLRGNRYRTICGRWITRLKNDHNVDLFRSKNTGFYCPSTQEVQAMLPGFSASVGRKYKRHYTRVALAKPINDAQAATQEHQLRLIAIARRETRKLGLNALPSTAATEHPRLRAPAAPGD